MPTPQGPAENRAREFLITLQAWRAHDLELAAMTSLKIDFEAETVKYLNLMRVSLSKITITTLSIYFDNRSRAAFKHNLKYFKKSIKKIRNLRLASPQPVNAWENLADDAEATAIKALKSAYKVQARAPFYSAIESLKKVNEIRTTFYS